MFFKSLRSQLLLVSCTAAVLLACLIALALGGYTVLVVVLSVILFLLLVAINIWFEQKVEKPISSLTESAKRIAAGSYGTKAENGEDDEIGALTKEINEMSEKVALADKATTEFVSQISHELRTPLTAITGWSETLQYDTAIQGDSLRGVTIITKEAERLKTMVADLLEFTRIQDGRFNLRVEQIDIAAELEDSIFTYGELMKQAGVEVNYEAPSYDIPPISADPERLKQVFLNLLDNALKHGGSGGSVDVVLKTTSSSVLISIRDHGHGIPAAELPYVKNKFYKGSSKNRGSGIGLAVCDEIIIRHGGKLIIANAEGGGVIVTVQLPLDKE